MNILCKQLIPAFVILAMSSFAQAGDSDSAQAHSLGEFDRVGVNQPRPKTGDEEFSRPSRKAVAGNARTADGKREAVKKAEFMRRLFWLALVSR